MDQLFADQEVTIEDLYPDLTPEERAEAQRQLFAYLSVVWQIYKRKEGIADTDPAARIMRGVLASDED